MINRKLLLISSVLPTCLLAVTATTQSSVSSTDTSRSANFEEHSFALLDGPVEGRIIEPSADLSGTTPGASAPEPATLSLLGLGILGIAVGLARKKQK